MRARRWAIEDGQDVPFVHVGLRKSALFGREFLVIAIAGEEVDKQHVDAFVQVS